MKTWMTPEPALIQAMDGAYAEFAACARPRALDASPTRGASAILATLSSAPLRQLTGEQIGPYAGWALTTVGSVEDYKHFLPRALEQAVRAPEWMGTMPQVVAARLKRAEWRTWPMSEQAVVRDVFLAAWVQSSKQHPDDAGGSSEWLCAIASLGEDVGTLLADWIEPANANAVLQIAELAVQIRALTSPDPDEQVFWADVAGDVRAQIAAWLASDQVSFVLVAAKGIGDTDLWRVHEAQKVLSDHAGQTRH